MSKQVSKPENPPTQSPTSKEPKQVGLPTKTVSLAALVGFITTYTHFFGLSYRKSYLEGVGFESITVSLSPDESIYYATEGFLRGLGRALKNSDFWSFEPSMLAPGIVFAVMFFIFWGKRQFFEKKETKENNNSPWNERLVNWCKSAPDSLLKTSALSVLGFLVGYGLQVAFAFFILASLSIFWLLMGLGSVVGHGDGRELIKSPVCQTFDWTERNEDRILGCRVIKLKDGSEIRGKRLHSSKDAVYFLTNNGAYEISNKGEIISFRPIHERPEPESKPEQEPASE